MEYDSVFLYIRLLPIGGEKIFAPTLPFHKPLRRHAVVRPYAGEIQAGGQVRHVDGVCLRRDGAVHRLYYLSHYNIQCAIVIAELDSQLVKVAYLIYCVAEQHSELCNLLGSFRLFIGQYH